METGALIRRTVERYFTGIVPLTVLSGLLLAALLMMHAATQNSAIFGRLYSLLLVVNLLGNLRQIPHFNPDILITKLRESRWFL